MTEPRSLTARRCMNFETMMVLGVILLSMILVETLVHSIGERFLAYFGLHNGVLPGFLDALVLFTILAPIYFHAAKERGKTVGITGALGDETGRLEAEQLSMTLHLAVENAAESIVITDPNATIMYVNPAFEDRYGYTSDEILGKNPRVLKSGEHKAEFYSAMWKTLLDGKAWKGRFINRRKDGTWVHEDTVISPVRDKTGRLVNYVCVKRDVTREIEMEDQLLALPSHQL